MPAKSKEAKLIQERSKCTSDYYLEFLRVSWSILLGESQKREVLERTGKFVDLYQILACSIYFPEILFFFTVNQRYCNYNMFYDTWDTVPLSPFPPSKSTNQPVKFQTKKQTPLYFLWSLSSVWQGFGSVVFASLLSYPWLILQLIERVSGVYRRWGTQSCWQSEFLTLNSCQHFFGGSCIWICNQGNCGHSVCKGRAQRRTHFPRWCSPSCLGSWFIHLWLEQG